MTLPSIPLAYTHTRVCIYVYSIVREENECAESWPPQGRVCARATRLYIPRSLSIKLARCARARELPYFRCPLAWVTGSASPFSSGRENYRDVWEWLVGIGRLHTAHCRGRIGWNCEGGCYSVVFVVFFFRICDGGVVRAMGEGWWGFRVQGWVWFIRECGMEYGWKNIRCSFKIWSYGYFTNSFLLKNILKWWLWSTDKFFNISSWLTVNIIVFFSNFNKI